MATSHSITKFLLPGPVISQAQGSVVWTCHFMLMAQFTWSDFVAAKISQSH